jgi:hypothetical protein
MPLTEYPEPFQAADEIVTSSLVADRVPVNDALLPTATLPKLSEEGDTARVPAEGGFTTTWLLVPLETPAQPRFMDTLTRARSVHNSGSRELFCLSMQRLSARYGLAVERTKIHLHSHDFH